jgi:hypothetical protein
MPPYSVANSSTTGRILCLANCHFAHDSSGFPILLLFFDSQSGGSCYPLDRHAGPVARTWWRPFPGRGVASPETPAPDRESLPATIAQSIRGGPHPCRLAGALGAPNPPSPFRNCTEALDTARATLLGPAFAEVGFEKAGTMGFVASVTLSLEPHQLSKRRS